MGLLASLAILPACTNVDPGLVRSGLTSHFQKSPEERKAALAEIAKADNWASLALWNTALGEAMYFLPDGYQSNLTKDEDTFLNYVLGAYLARYPDVTYDSLDKSLFNADILDKAGVSRERFEYARGFGRVWLKSIQDDPKNRAMKERVTLFRQRFGSSNPDYYTSIFSPHKIRALLRDDKAFEAFLKDDGSATAWVQNNMDINKTTRDKTFQNLTIQDLLRPVTIGVLPGLAS
ncbi:MAG: hypothetical protein CTY25_15175 [Methylobacterium sp.]|nr:MAG: hypothetical protein CTY25_15175 [Methylobacterium sp.]